MVYNIIGNSGSGKTTLGKKIHKFLGTERRNWRRDVFLIDDDQIREIYSNNDYTEKGIRKNINDVHNLAEYLHVQGCDVVVSIMSPYIELREVFKERLGVETTEIFLHTSDDRETDKYKVPTFDHPEVNFIDLDTTKKSPDRTFAKLITILVKTDKL